MQVTRRDFMKAASAIAAGLGLGGFSLRGSRTAYAREGAQSVVWLQAQNCAGCSVSLLNTIYYMTIDTLLLQTIDLNFHQTVMAGAGGTAVAAAEAARAAGGYVLVVEGAVPTAANGAYCELWPGLTALAGVQRYAANAAAILAVGTCACYGGVPAAGPNPTSAKGLRDLGLGKPVVNIPGCPAHPDWIIGTVAYLLANGAAPALDSIGRPMQYFGGDELHDECPRKESYEHNRATQLGQSNCMYNLGCRGRRTHCDCDRRKWNGAAAGVPGISYCIQANTPCIGCTEPTFPGPDPIYGVAGSSSTTTTRPTTTTTRPSTTTTQPRTTTTTQRTTTTTNPPPPPPTSTTTSRTSGTTTTTLPANDYIIDNSDNTPARMGLVVSGTWGSGKSLTDKYGADYRYAYASTGGETARWRWTTNALPSGEYAVHAWWPTDPNRSKRVPFFIKDGGRQLATMRVDQTANGGRWNYLGTFFFSAGGHTVEVGNGLAKGSAAEQFVGADAVKFVPAGAVGFSGMSNARTRRKRREHTESDD